MSKLKHYLNHCCHAIRYGKWYCGWEMYKDKPMLGFFHYYYDGYMAAFHLYKFYVEVHY